MRWEIKGADASTGDDRTIIVDADDEKDALAQANRNGLFVESARQLEIVSIVEIKAAAPIATVVEVVATVVTRRDPAQEEEEVFYEGIGGLVTDSRVQLGSKTYVLSKIDAVEVKMMHPNPRVAYGLLGLGALVAILGGVLSLFLDLFPGVFALMGGIAAIAAGMYVMKHAHPTFAIMLDISSGRHFAYQSGRSAIVREIQEAIIQATTSAKRVAEGMGLGNEAPAQSITATAEQRSEPTMTPRQSLFLPRLARNSSPARPHAGWRRRPR